MPIKISTTTALQLNQILRQSTLILISIVMTKSAFGTAQIGIYETLMFISYTLSFFWINAFLQTILTQYPSVSEADKLDYPFNIFLIFNALSIFIFLILWLIPNLSLLVLTGKNEVPNFGVFTFYLLFFLPPFLLESVWAVENRPLSILGFSVLTNGLFLLSIAYPIWTGEGLTACISLLVWASLARYFYLIFAIVSRQKFKIKKGVIRQFIKMATPLMGYALVGGGIVAFGGWLVNWYYKGDFEVFAVYRFGSREFPIINALITGLSSAMIPILLQKGEKTGALSKNTEPAYPKGMGSASFDMQAGFLILKQKSLRIWHILFPMSIVLMFLSKPLFQWIFNAEMVKAVPIFNTFLLLLISRALFPQPIVVALKETKKMFWISMIEVFCIVILGFILIHLIGIQGVAWAMVIGFLIEKILMIVFLKKQYNINFQDYTNVNIYLFYTFALIVSYCVNCVANW